jgi:hypothetical protein
MRVVSVRFFPLSTTLFDTQTTLSMTLSFSLCGIASAQDSNQHTSGTPRENFIAKILLVENSQFFSLLHIKFSKPLLISFRHSLSVTKAYSLSLYFSTQKCEL